MVSTGLVMDGRVTQLLEFADVLFWDFDGVIKESVEVKTNAFVKLFHKFGREIADRVREHHEANGGMSRFDKLPLYLEWAGECCSQSSVNQLCDQFACLVLDEVVRSPWVPGVELYLRSNPYGQTFFLVSATPQNELEHIIQKLNLTDCFSRIIGAPTSKIDALGMTLEERNINSKDCIMIGDAQEDYLAAQANHVPFLLRLHATNAKLFINYSGSSVNDFTEL